MALIFTACPEFQLETESGTNPWISERHYEFPVIVTEGEADQIQRALKSGSDQYPVILTKYIKETAEMAFDVFRKKHPMLKFTDLYRCPVKVSSVLNQN